jgi:hypothetical protein
MLLWVGDNTAHIHTSPGTKCRQKMLLWVGDSSKNTSPMHFLSTLGYISIGTVRWY